MNKIYKVYNILKNRLPKDYITPIKIFLSTKKLLQYTAKIEGESYKETIEYYNNYFSSSQANYTTTKYWKNKRPKSAMGITALSGEPILLSFERLKNRPLYEICFLLLHEIGHNVFPARDEKSADIFAKRWLRKLIKEGLIKCNI